MNAQLKRKVLIVIVIDSGEPEHVFEAFDEKGIPYIKAEIRFYFCENCGKVYTANPEICDECGETRITSERVGDFTNTNRTFLVERKTPADFVSSMLDKSLHSQAARMAKYFAGWKFVFLEGFISVMVDDPHNTNISNWIRSMRVTLRQYDVCMWQMDDIYMLIYELRRLDEKCGETPQIHEKIDDKYSGWSNAKKIVCKLIDVSDKKADILLEKFKTPWNIFQAIGKSDILYTKSGKPKLDVDSPFYNLKGFGVKFVLKNRELLLLPDGKTI